MTIRTQTSEILEIPELPPSGMFRERNQTIYYMYTSRFRGFVGIAAKIPYRLFSFPSLES